jgi:hypothetical protein
MTVKLFCSVEVAVEGFKSQAIFLGFGISFFFQLKWYKDCVL